nr:hypothetical protein [uncultured Vibrio sp.]
MIVETLKADLVEVIKASQAYEQKRNELANAAAHQRECSKMFEKLLRELPEPDVFIGGVVVKVNGRVYHPSLNEEDGSLLIEEVTERTEVIEG